MRIITGSAKGSKLKTPRGIDTRPTADRVKESVFSILGGLVLEARVLDIFAGTGNLGLEALSRGAMSAVFVDKSSASIEVIKENILQTKLVDGATVIKGDSLAYLGRCIRETKAFDLVFCDPPYNKGLVGKVLGIIDNSNLLSKDGAIVVEHSKHELIDNTFSRLTITRTEKYGETLVSFIRLREQEV